MNISLRKLKHIHFVGIKGVGMTALALCAQDLGIKITGSDTGELFVTDKTLKKRGIRWKEGFSSNNLLPEPDLVISTAAFDNKDNPEILEAEKLGIPVMTQGEAVGLFSRGKETVAVCGVGGKSTTSALMSTILVDVGENPSYIVGVGEIFPTGAPGRYDEKSRLFVSEADEYANLPGVDNRPKFLFLDPKVVIVTNIEHDHPDIYPNLEDTKKAYQKFFNKIPKNGLLIANADSKNVLDVVSRAGCRVVTYGLSKNATYQVTNFRVEKQKALFDLVVEGEKVSKLTTNLPGTYNALNIASAFAGANFLGVSTEKIIHGVESFKGTRRRFETIGKTGKGALIIDDYAHHPKEIEMVIKAAREFYPDKRLVVVFQPHTYSRTKALFTEFAKAFARADIACFMDIYSSAREKKDTSVSSEKLTQSVAREGVKAYYTKGHEQTLAWLKENLDKKDLLLTLGAGDIFYLHDKLIGGRS